MLCTLFHSVMVLLGEHKGSARVGPGRDLFRSLFSRVFLHASSALLKSILSPIWPPLWIKIWPKIVKSQVLQAPSKEQPKNLPLSVENGSF